MRPELPIVHFNGIVVESRRHLLEQLQRELALGTARVSYYSGADRYGPEAFYTLSDGTLLHEITDRGDDGRWYHMITLVPPQPSRFNRVIQRFRARLLHT